MRIAPFKVEEWMNAYETEAVYNIAETCVDSLTVEELIRLSDEPEDFFREMAQKKLTYGSYRGFAGIPQPRREYVSNDEAREHFGDERGDWSEFSHLVLARCVW
ncbi:MULTISPECIES: hypothetical protein [unclassified Brevibacillus]|uniref:hypothetical protein n=1 Tax=unclassified Brevibacillus TaxID=2684853 RepID=UPI003563384D